MKEIFKNDGTPKAIIKGQMIIIINKDNIIVERYFGGMAITVKADGDLDILYPETPTPVIPSSITIDAIEDFKNRVVKAVPEEKNEININETNIRLLNNTDTATNETVPENKDPEFKHQDDSDYWDFNKSEETKTKDAVAVTKSEENLPAEYVETPYAKVISLIEDFIREYEECSEIPTHSSDLYDTEYGYNGVYFNSKIGHAPYHFRIVVENDPKTNTIYMCFDPRKQHGVYKASTQRVGGSDNGAYTCRLTFATGSGYKRLLSPGDISGWEIHNKDISDLLKEIKGIFDTSEIEHDAFCGSYHI